MDEVPPGDLWCLKQPDSKGVWLLCLALQLHACDLTFVGRQELQMFSILMHKIEAGLSEV